VCVGGGIYLAATNKSHEGDDDDIHLVLWGKQSSSPSFKFSHREYRSTNTTQTNHTCINKKLQWLQASK